jgi:predicted GIY-YIG superfamily endonuclease
VKQPVVYILASKPYGTLYIGVTSSLAQRIEAHRNGCVDGFAKQETQEVEPCLEDQADRGDESRVERSLGGGFLISERDARLRGHDFLNWVPAFAGTTQHFP